MAPMNWLILFIMFFSTFLLNSNLIYFIYLKKMKNSIFKKKMTKNYNKFI
uniref:ATP synthase subunit 8 n=1 Tax=Thripsaphis sp. YW-2015 TaxID=1667253 RepID=A0A1L1YMT9_9HEMI|nr:ATP synthase subunit 8 [Thripsaphis sp. YW-2015]